jgi:molybdate transport system ATP-binding protein/molybdate transport system permease protein
VIPFDLSPLWISLKTSTAATAVAFVSGIAAAAGMSRYRGKGRGVLDGIFNLPLVLPPTVVGFFLLLLFGRRSAVGQVLEHIGLRIAFSWPATVVAASVVAFPLMYRATLGAFEQVNPNLLGAARTLGASEWRTFRLVLLPLARPGVMAGTVLAFARALGEFGATLMLAGNIPGKTQTMPIAIFFAAEGGDMRRAMDWVVAIAILSLVTIAALNYWVPRQRAPRGAGSAAEPVPDSMMTQPLIVAHRRANGRAEAGGTSGLTVDLSKTYPGFQLSVAFSANGGPLGLLGPSGSGKSMTLRCIAGLEKPEQGRVSLNGRVLLDTSKGIDLSPAKRRVGMVFQDYALFPHLTVRENIGFGLHGEPGEERRKRIAQWSGMMQIESLLDCYPGQLSGGQRQRVALARALAMEPEALLLDEPLSALDPHLRRQTEEQLRERLGDYAGATLFVTHDRDEAFRFCRDMVVLSGGKVAAAGPKSEIFARPQTLAVARLTGCKNFSRMRRAEAQDVRLEDWNCTLRVGTTVPERAGYVGIRAHDLRIVQHAAAENTFPCWLVASVESPFETTLYLRLHAPPQEGDQSHVEAEVSRELWAELSGRPQPWHLFLDPASLLFLQA